MESVIIERKLYLHPKFFNKDILSNIETEAKKTFLYECSEQYGYIMKINRIVRIKDNKISNTTSNCIFTVILEIEVIKPQIGNIYEGVICASLSYGLLININEKIKVFVPEVNNTYSVGDKVKIQINGLQYNPC